MRLRAKLRRARRRYTFIALRQVMRAAGFTRARRIGHLLGDLQFHLNRPSRLRMQADIAHWLGWPARDARAATLLHEAHRVNNAAVMEILAMFDRHQDEQALAACVQIDGTERLRAAMAEGRGAILLATHMGNAALVATSLARDGWPVTVVYRQARMMSAGFLQRGLESYGIQGILANAGIRAYGQMLAALKKGRVVFMMFDQGAKKAKDGVPQRFLGKDMPMPAGPAQLARAAKAPLLPLAITGTAPRWCFEILEPVALGQDALEDDVQRLVALTEAQVRAHPQWWSWHHRRWRDFPAAADHQQLRTHDSRSA